MVIPCHNDHDFPDPYCRLCWLAGLPTPLGAKYRSAWQLDDAHIQTSVISEPLLDPPDIPTGPGTELTRLLSQAGITKLSGCRCSGHAQRMNRWGVEGCRKRRDRIVGWLRESYDLTGWATRIRAGVNLALDGVCLSTDPFGDIVDECIRRAAL